ncbi:tyrosine-type recombinase/integrase [Dactylosporangium sp. CA-139114]|uniref:tyrosine-type recombinase/integrase n=1 Tax=Dactylosporangium sp. CA-139114 TaxID=3239931 RepID=UPI003D97F5B8
MASIETRQHKSSPPTYRVKWLTGGRRGGEPDYETFDNLRDAKKFKSLVDAHGNVRPDPDVLTKFGFAHLADLAQPSADSVHVSSAVPPETAMPTFEQWARDYVADLVTVNPETRRKYLERLEEHVFPTLGSLPVDAITVGDCKRWQKELQRKGLSVKTIKNIRGDTVYPAFEKACLPGDDGERPLRGYNPLKGVPVPKAIPYNRQVVSDTEEAEILIAAAYTIDPEIGDLVVTKLSTGMRWGEIAALCVRALNKRQNSLYVLQVARRIDNVWIIEAMPKTEDGFRQIPTTDPVMSMLVRRASGRRPNDFLFSPPSGSPFWLYHNFYKKWEKILKLAQMMGLPKHITPHGLRASLLTWLASEGIDLEALRNIAGHKHVTTTYKFYVKQTTRHFAAVKAAVSPLVAVAPKLDA